MSEASSTTLERTQGDSLGSVGEGGLVFQTLLF
jgi:hypothetical protein